MSDEILNDDFLGETGDLELSRGPRKPLKRLSLDKTFEILKEYVDTKAKFTNAQMNICTEVLITMLPVHEREFLYEIAKDNNYPIWVVLLAQWRRLHEYSEVAALLVDPEWIEKVEEKH